MVQSIIAKANGNNKVIDFRDSLNAANVEDYAMMHGVGGEKHARSSVIRLTICDFTSGTGDASRTVSANISPTTCEKIYEVCKGNIGTMVIPNDLAPIAEQRASNRALKKIADMQFEVLQHVIKLSNNIVNAAKKNNAPGIVAIAEALGIMLGKAKNRVLANGPEDSVPPYFELPRHCDLNHIQDRVHASKKDAEGFAPVQRLTISHRTYRKDGSLSQYPWTIKVTNGEALVRVSENGATTFDSHTLRNVVEAFIVVSDEDMYRCMNRVIRYIDAWEKLKGLPLIKSGLAQKQAEYEAYRNSQQEGV